MSSGQQSTVVASGLQSLTPVKRAPLTFLSPNRANGDEAHGRRRKGPAQKHNASESPSGASNRSAKKRARTALVRSPLQKAQKTQKSTSIKAITPARRGASPRKTLSSKKQSSGKRLFGSSFTASSTRESPLVDNGAGISGGSAEQSVRPLHFGVFRGFHKILESPGDDTQGEAHRTSSRGVTQQQFGSKRVQALKVARNPAASPTSFAVYDEHMDEASPLQKAFCAWSGQRGKKQKKHKSKINEEEASVDEEVSNAAAKGSRSQKKANSAKGKKGKHRSRRKARGHRGGWGATVPLPPPYSPELTDFGADIEASRELGDQNDGPGGDRHNHEKGQGEKNEAAAAAVLPAAGDAVLDVDDVSFPRLNFRIHDIEIEIDGENETRADAFASSIAHEESDGHEWRSAAAHEAAIAAGGGRVLLRSRRDTTSGSIGGTVVGEGGAARTLTSSRPSTSSVVATISSDTSSSVRDGSTSVSSVGRSGSCRDLISEETRVFLRDLTSAGPIHFSPGRPTKRLSSRSPLRPTNPAEFVNSSSSSSSSSSSHTSSSSSSALSFSSSSTLTGKHEGTFLTVAQRKRLRQALKTAQAAAHRARHRVRMMSARQRSAAARALMRWARRRRRDKMRSALYNLARNSSNGRGAAKAMAGPGAVIANAAGEVDFGAEEEEEEEAGGGLGAVQADDEEEEDGTQRSATSPVADLFGSMHISEEYFGSGAATPERGMGAQNKEVEKGRRGEDSSSRRYDPALGPPLLDILRARFVTPTKAAPKAEEKATAEGERRAGSATGNKSRSAQVPGKDGVTEEKGEGSTNARRTLDTLEKARRKRMAASIALNGKLAHWRGKYTPASKTERGDSE